MISTELGKPGLKHPVMKMAWLSCLVLLLIASAHLVAPRNVFAQAGTYVTKTIVADPPEVILKHDGQGSSDPEEHYVVAFARNLPPSSLIKSINFYAIISFAGEAEDLKIKTLINESEDPLFKIWFPSVLLSVVKGSFNPYNFSHVIERDAYETPLKYGGDLKIEGFITVKSKELFSVKLSNIYGEMIVKSGNTILFPSKLVVSPILDKTVSERVGITGMQEHGVVKGSEIVISLLWDDVPVSEKTLSLNDVIEAQMKVSGLKWETKSFINDKTPEGQHTIQLRFSFDGQDEAGNSTGRQNLLVPPEPLPIIVLGPDSASDYFPTAFVNIYGTDTIPEDIQQQWSFMHLVTLFKKPPDPLIDRSRGKAEKCAGVLAESLVYSVDWGDGTPIESGRLPKALAEVTWQPAQSIGHKYTVPGDYRMTVTVGYSMRTFTPWPSLEELSEWKAVDIPGEVKAEKMIKVLDTTPPVIGDPSEGMDVPPGTAPLEQITTTGNVIALDFRVQENLPCSALGSAKVHYKFKENWEFIEVPGDEARLLSPPKQAPAIFSIPAKLKIPMDRATKPRENIKYPVFLEVSDLAGNTNKGDPDIRDNDQPPTYGADTLGPVGELTVYDNMPPDVEISFDDPTRRVKVICRVENIMSGNDLIARCSVSEKAPADAEPRQVFLKTAPNTTTYPVKERAVASGVVAFPWTIKVAEDERFKISVRTVDMVDGAGTGASFFVDGKELDSSEKDALTYPLIFRQPGKKTLKVEAADKPNVDGSFNPLVVEFPMEILDTTLSVQSIR